MRVVMRVDASLQIGSGHVMRCLTLADELRSRGAEVHFICREHSGNLCSLIEERGYPIVRLADAAGEYIASAGDPSHASWLGVSWQRDAEESVAALPSGSVDWLIIDHYALDRRWEEQLRTHVGKIMVIDDLADRFHDCDLLLDQNLNRDLETRYNSLVTSDCNKMLGPRYALLRPEFVAFRKALRQRDGVIRQVLVFFGGVDKTNETYKALQALASIVKRQFKVDVVVGSENFHKKQLQDYCASYDGFRYHCQVDNMAELMTTADLAIGAGGSTTWERCVLGLPTIVMTLAANQMPIARTVADHGAVVLLGDASDISITQLRTVILELGGNYFRLREMSHCGMRLLDGTGADKVCSLMVSADVRI